jgi:putative ABC transport system substrate-binding protein
MRARAATATTTAHRAGRSRLPCHAAVYLLAAALLALLTGCVALPPGLQPPQRPYRVGYLTSSPIGSPASAEGYLQFRQRLEELGLREGQNLTIEYRHTDGKEDRFPALAAELVSLPVDVLVLGDSRAIPTARQATSTIPIVMANSGDVVGQGLVASLAQPGGNLTGLTNLATMLNAKRLELLLQVQPQPTRVAILWNPDLPGARPSWSELQAAAPALGVELISLEMHAPGEVPGAFEQAASQRANGLLVLPDPLTNLQAQQIVDLAAQRRLPAIYGTKLFVDAGGLMHYGPDRAAMFRRAADYVDKIRGGASPATLPIEQPSVFEFVVNLKHARALGFDLPPSLVGQATERRE